MKKIIQLSLILFTFLNLKAQNNYGTITYKKLKLTKTYTEDKKERLGVVKFKKFSKIEESMIKAYKVLEFTLDFNNDESIFKVQNFLETPKHRFLKFSVGPEGQGIYYNSREERIRKMNSFGEDFLIYHPKPPLNWKLQNETKKIGKYIAYKATTVEKVKTGRGVKEYLITAWYAPEVNIHFGPIGFSGLPGLIIELERNGIQYYVHNIKWNPKKQLKIDKPKKGKKITIDEYREIAINAMKRYRKIRG
jgi:GLPGLI family protein